MDEITDVTQVVWGASLHWSTLWLTNLQVNTPAAEVLYTVIQEWALLDGGSTVLDVCCGTGTIGLALAPVSLTAPEHLPTIY